MKQYDFAGYVTKYNILCTDGRTILKDAFKHQDGKIVPLVWAHNSDEGPENILGQILLEHRDDGMYGYGSFNKNRRAVDAKEAVAHKDITKMSVYAGHLRQTPMRGVIDGFIKEVSLVVSGANSGANIDNYAVMHSDDYYELGDEAVISTGEDFTLFHEDKESKEIKENDLSAIYEGMSDDEKMLLYGMVGEALKENEAKHKEDDNMKENIFDKGTETLKHADYNSIIENAKTCGSFKKAWMDAESELKHDDPSYGIGNIEYLFPEAKAVTATPEFIKRRTEWVNFFINNASKVPFGKIKSLHADITEDAARAKGYIKGALKAEEYFALSKRETNSATVYKKQKLDKDDIDDINGSIDVVAWLWGEMRGQLDEEVARAGLVGDGRSAGSPDKIDPTKIRPIYTDSELYTVRMQLNAFTPTTTNAQKAEAIIEAALRARENYEGSGLPTFFCTEATLTTMLLARDTLGRRLYRTEAELATEMRVAGFQTVPVMKDLTYTDDDENEFDLIGIMVNPVDYKYGATKGGQISRFSDFDIDYNQNKYLIETRTCGALTKFHSAVVIESAVYVPPTPEDDEDDEDVEA